MKISVVVPAYNASPFLKEAIESALGQTYPPHEVLVVDDGSTDGTAEVARSFGSNVRLLKQSNQGPAASRNRGVEEATGDWIAFLDADDVFLPDKLLLQARAVEQHPSALLVYAGLRLLFPDGSTRDCPALPVSALWPTLRYRSVIVVNVLVERSAFLTCGGFDTSFRRLEDWELWLRFIRRYSVAAFAVVPEPVMIYRVVPGSNSSDALAMLAQHRVLLDTRLLVDLKGMNRSLWRRRILARFLYETCIALREQGNPLYLNLAAQSLLQWPFFGRILPVRRYKVFVRILVYELMQLFRRTEHLRSQ